MFFRFEILISLAINFFFIVLCFTTGIAQYGAIDDFYMAAILTGAHGNDYNPHLLFVNAIYGSLLIPLYKIAPSVGWYYLGEVCSVFLSLVSICFVIIKKLGVKWGTIVAILFVALTSRDLYLVLQFTLCASILSAAGMLLFGYLVGEGFFTKQTYVFLVISIVFLWWGAIMRWQAFLMGLPFFAVILLLQIKRCWIYKKTVLVGLAIFFVVAIAMRQYDQNLYRTSEYRQYTEIQGPRAALGDYANYDILAVEDDLNEFEKSEVDFYMLRNWMFYDTEIFKPDSIKVYYPFINNYAQQYSWKSSPPLLMDGLLKSVGNSPFWVFFMAFVLVYVSNKKKVFFAFFAFCMVIAYMLYLIYIGRLVYRVEEALWIYAAICIILCCNEIKKTLPNKLWFIILALLCAWSTCVFVQKGKFVRDPSSSMERLLVVNEDTTDYKRVFSYMNEHKENLFLLSMQAYKRLSHHVVKPYESVPMGCYKNVIPIGFWTPYLPEITESLKEYGVENPLKDVVKENVIVYDIPNLVPFLQEHYYDSVGVDSVMTIGEKTFFKYRIVK